ncbi:MAG: FAD-dependent oxidoreductase [Alicyclobacillus sp.]|nr:FAD-dependent oxidoreductase [Alicyclobacillus sp.]
MTAGALYARGEDTLSTSAPWTLIPSTYPALAQPGRIGSLMLPHRILMGSMHLGVEGDSAQEKRLHSFYAERVQGGAALIITGGAAVSPEGGGDHWFCLTQPDHQRQLARLAEHLHALGGKVALQLFHAGRYAFADEIGATPWAPSAIASKFTRETPRAMTRADIRATVEAFAAAARFARAAGFAAVEVMGSEGYLLNQFLSPLTNQRQDEYGGSLENRMRLSLEVVAAIRDATGPDFPLLFRMSGADCMPGSTSWEETVVFAQRLEQAGVDALNIGIGWHESLVPTVAAVVPRGGFAPVVAGIKAAVRIPVIGANRINTPEVADRLIALGWLDFVAPARPWLADAAFARKALQGDRAGLNVCIACNQSCLDHVMDRPPRPASCLANPRAGQEYDWPLAPARSSRRVAVVGGGPAGLEAARTAAQRGHAVTLFEAMPVLGGQLRLAAQVAGKEEFWETLRYYQHELARLGVEVRLNTRASVQDLRAFDAVLLATGVAPALPDLPGVHLPHVVSYSDLLSGRVAAGRRVAILGAGGIGCDVALYLAKGSHPPASVQAFLAHHRLAPGWSATTGTAAGAGASPAAAANGAGSPAATTAQGMPRTITLLARSQRIAATVGRTTRWVVRSELHELGIQTLTHFQAKAVVDEGILGTVHGEERLIPADQVVICTGQVPRRELWEELADHPWLRVIGGARETRGLNAARAIREGFEAAYEL